MDTSAPTTILTLVLYALPALMLWRQLLRQPNEHISSGVARAWQIIILLAVILHGWQVYHALYTSQGLNVGLFSILSLVGWLCALLLLIASLTQPIACLGTVVYPFAGFTVLLRQVLVEPHGLALQLSPGLELHILLSVLAYSLLSIAVTQAILLYFQETHLHNKQPSGFVRGLPPLETMELLMFRMIALGFAVLSLSLLSGFFYLEDMFAQHLVHKTVLSILAWGLFAILLLGRWRFGWRGRVAIRWTIGAFVLLMLAYFGSKFVIEMILHR